MSYQVLARKLRPPTFDSLVGQDHVVRALKHALDHDRLHHAYLFTGTRGVGKTTIARVFAKCLNCETGVSSTPCGECSVCREVAENRFIDLIEVDAASRTRVDDTRDLLENAQYLPTRGRYKVYLIDEVHMLSASSFNALLKTLEEPPEHVKFLLATTDPKKVPVTVLSRCLQFQLKNISADRMFEYLRKVLAEESVTFDEGALEVISRAARGSMRDALSITDQAIAFGGGTLTQADVVEMLGLVGTDEVGALIDAIAQGDAVAVLAVVKELAERALDFESLLAELLAAMHDMAVKHATGHSADVPLGAEVVQLYYQIGLMGYRDLQIAPDPRSGIEMTLLRMLSFTPDSEGGISRDHVGRDGPLQLSTSEKPTQIQIDDATQQLTEDNPATESSSAHQPQRARERSTWHDLVSNLQLGGVARMIAEHSVLQTREGNEFSLILDQAHDTLLSDSLVEVIRRSLSEAIGQEAKITITAGDVNEETPAQRRVRLADERQRDAELILRKDATVQSLLDEFGGHIDDVQAIDHSNNSDGAK